MAVKIDPEAARKLTRKDKRRQAVAPPPPKPKATPNAAPSSSDPNTSVIAALWALPGRPGDTLMIRKKSTGTAYRVISYNPATQALVLALEKPNSDGSYHKFDSKVSPQVERDYEPWWR